MNYRINLFHIASEEIMAVLFIKLMNIYKMKNLETYWWEIELHASGNENNTHHQKNGRKLLKKHLKAIDAV